MRISGRLNGVLVAGSHCTRPGGIKLSTLLQQSQSEYKQDKYTENGTTSSNYTKSKTLSKRKKF